mgnify:CR=1 FL=1
MLQTEKAKVQFLEVSASNGTPLRIAYEYHAAPGSTDPGMVWFPGFNSTMSSTKVSALKDWALKTRRSLLCFDYSGHGSSGGEFEDGTISDWLNQSLAILREVVSGPQILVGSSMGAWFILLILRAISRNQPVASDLPRIDGALLIAPAHDMTEELMWKEFSDEARHEIETTGSYQRPSRYGDGPYTITQKLIEDGRHHLIGSDSFRPPCPVRMIHGIADADVPWKHANKLTHILTGEGVMLKLGQDGDHRLSRPRDIEKMFCIIDDLYENIAKNAHYI